MRTLILATAAIYTFSVSSVAALENWRCVVEDFKGFGEKETEFLEANLRKRFMITENDDQILVKMTSTDFHGNDKEYRIIVEDMTDKHGMASSLVSFDTISLPKKPRNQIESRGFFNATISMQGSFISNSWLLRCVE